MPTYRLDTLADVKRAIQVSKLDEFPHWPKWTSAKDFEHWLFIRGADETDTEGLYRWLQEYLKVVPRKRGRVLHEQDARELGEDLDRHHAKVLALAAAVRAVRSRPEGDKVMQCVSLFAVRDEGRRPWSEIPRQLLPAILQALHDIGLAAENLRTSVAFPYRPGLDPFLDWMLQQQIWRLDESIHLELPWSGREPYCVSEVIALVQVALDLKLRAECSKALELQVSRQSTSADSSHASRMH